MEMQPEFRFDDEEEPRFLGLEFDLSTDGEQVEDLLEEVERDRYDEQILAALVSP
jgi:hypothetical protein